MRSVRIGITDSLDDRELTGVIEGLETREGGVKTERIVEFQNLGRGNINPRAGFVVMIVAVRNQCVESVVSTCHLQNHEDRGVLAGGDLCGFVSRFSLQRGKCVRQESGHGPGQRTGEDCSAQEFAPGLEGDFFFHTHGVPFLRQLILGRAHDEPDCPANIGFIQLAFGIQILAQRRQLGVFQF
jgi:hypothetical protein